MQHQAMIQEQVKEAPIDADRAQIEHPQPTGEAAPRRGRRDPAALWRALAGMAISLALACLIVMLEFTGQAAHRAARMRRHADALFSRVVRLEMEIAAERARISTAHRELAAAESLRALLRAPDAGMLLLSAPRRAHAAASDERPEATLALAPAEHRAVLMVAGLKSAANDMLFVLWWNAARGAPVKAAEFRTAADGSALLTAALPPGLAVTAAMITVERAATARASNGSVATPEVGAASSAGAANSAGSGNSTPAPADAAPAAHTASVQAVPAGPVLLRGALAR